MNTLKQWRTRIKRDEHVPKETHRYKKRDQHIQKETNTHKKETNTKKRNENIKTKMKTHEKWRKRTKSESSIEKESDHREHKTRVIHFFLYWSLLICVGLFWCVWSLFIRVGLYLYPQNEGDSLFSPLHRPLRAPHPPLAYVGLHDYRVWTRRRTSWGLISTFVCVAVCCSVL